MKLLNNLQLALVIVLLTDLATFDYKSCKSKKLTEGTCPKKKCILQKCAIEEDGTSSCQKIDCPVRLASCGMKKKTCNACVKEKPSCPQKEPTVCPFCGQEMCPQQEKSSCPQPKNACPQEKPSGCPGQEPNCPNQKPPCQSQKQKQQKPQPKPICRGQKPSCGQSKSKCPQPAPKSKCPPPPKSSCPNDKPACPERCSLFRSFPFSNVISPKKTESPIVERKGKCNPNCPGGDACKGKT